MSTPSENPSDRPAHAKLKGRVHHSVCSWCYNPLSVEDLCKAAVEIGIESVELVGPADFPTLKAYGLTCAMVTQPSIKAPSGVEIGGIERAFNRREHHSLLARAYEPWINTAADAGFKNLVCFSGNRDRLDDETGLKNCAEGIAPLLPLCEKRGVTLCMELLNSKVDHIDYMCDHTSWGVDLVNRVGSKNFKLLYDIYHMQIMEGDIIATISRHHDLIAHYHTGGVPGRHEIDNSQELNYPAIIQAILATGYKGYIGQEFLPIHPRPLEGLRQGVSICDV